MFELLIFVLGVSVGAVALAFLRRRAEEGPLAGAEETAAAPPESEDTAAALPEPAPAATETIDQKEPRTVADPDSRRWQPPYISGQPLLEWARSVSRGIVREATGEGLDAATAGEIAGRLAPAFGQAMLPDAQAEVRNRPVPCPATGQGITGLTPPEAIALAAWLRAHLTAEELEELMDDITLCDEWIGNATSGAPCALQGHDGVCRGFGARPIGCRPTLAMTLASRLQEETGMPGGARSFADAHVDTVARGVMEGLREGLELKGLDNRVYELHSALRRVLSRPDAAAEWARGEDVFERCREVRERR